MYFCKHIHCLRRFKGLILYIIKLGILCESIKGALTNGMSAGLIYIFSSSSSALFHSPLHLSFNVLIECDLP